ncbi:MAG: [FeFe] hydrogenase H-cluster radical SAM maturase HydE [Spirochaetes bacterium GWF1_51_8]|nr:MAG: [FeFe] hydrogenase H-cluster radical SAM maturase HydE [Spirochaetes bacterium GWF1_51_8]
MDWKNLTFNDLPRILRSDDDETLRSLLDHAYSVKMETVGKNVYFRGLIEYSNLCAKNCYYCGIRRGNRHARRYTMTREETVDAGLFAFKQNMGSIVLQSGERCDREFTETIEGIIAELKERTGGKLGITLSLGEQTRETYRRWYGAGAHRYLLRIEASNPELYRKLHPAGHDFDLRRNCLIGLKEIGYQTGTGVMIGLPFQTGDDLVSDLEFFREMDIDMIGMGPYIVHNETPLAAHAPDSPELRRKHYHDTLKMIAFARILLRDVNIAATTAMQVLDPFGRERALKAGANIIMPNITPMKYRSDYALYEGKPCVDEEPDQCLGCLTARIRMIGEEPGLGQWGDSLHFRKNADSPIETEG